MIFGGLEVARLVGCGAPSDITGQRSGRCRRPTGVGRRLPVVHGHPGRQSTVSRVEVLVVVGRGGWPDRGARPGDLGQENHGGYSPPPPPRCRQWWKSAGNPGLGQRHLDRDAFQAWRLHNYRHLPGRVDPDRPPGGSCRRMRAAGDGPVREPGWRCGPQCPAWMVRCGLSRRRCGRCGCLRCRCWGWRCRRAMTWSRSADRHR